jgi:hypothetical protein
MRLVTTGKTVFRKTRGYRSFAAVMLLAASGLMCAQSSQPSACKMDSDGFCVPGAAQAAPVGNLAPQQQKELELSPALQSKMQPQSSPALQNKLQVEFRNHQLRIDAENTTLRDTLKAISARTGAEVQFPAVELGERIFVHLGPGSARDVITQLLNGSQFNYVILSLASDPGGITRLILSRASSAGERASSDAPALPVSDSAENQLYGAAFSVDPDAPAEPVLSQPTGAAAAPGASPATSAPHIDGAKLSGEDLDRMQKMQIQQEQQQLRQQQLQQQPQNSAPQ